MLHCDSYLHFQAGEAAQVCCKSMLLHGGPVSEYAKISPLPNGTERRVIPSPHHMRNILHAVVLKYCLAEPLSERGRWAVLGNLMSMTCMVQVCPFKTGGPNRQRHLSAGVCLHGALSAIWVLQWPAEDLQLSADVQESKLRRVAVQRQLQWPAAQCHSP
jgi:hypothetical protein